ncbi:hypothetical protein NUW58_g546 [Xylaria curta]|uniref:Uncharacterized protein n=1 Tax=Xylaria curta TaxID=42375 RepID=A0ACC1PQ14_9PEZI|nr:hypothetical protein NUW58_g546 [Xylaria curta]
MAADNDANTICTIHSFSPFIYFKENRKFLDGDTRTAFGIDPQRRGVGCADASHDEDATPPPEEVHQPFFRITTDHEPSTHSNMITSQPWAIILAALMHYLLILEILVETASQGYIFGRNPDVCDILLDYDSKRAISRTHFALKVSVTQYEGLCLVLHSLSRSGTTIRSTGMNSERITSQRFIPPHQKELIVLIGAGLEFRIELPDHSKHLELWEKSLGAYCRKYDCQAPSSLTLSPAPLNPNIPWKKQYDVLGVAGRGTFGTVYRVMHGETGRILAAKEFHDQEEARRLNSESKLSCLLGVEHENIVPYLGVCHNPLTLFMELGSGDLEAAVNESQLQSLELRDAAYQIISALDYLHQRHITHRDLKPPNIMVFARRPIRVKLVDLDLIGTAKAMQTYCGTPTYLAPECDRPQMGYTNKVDIWSVGILTLELSYGLPSEDTSTKWATTVVRYVQNLLPRTALVDFISALLQINPRRRPGAAQSRSHFVFSETHAWSAPKLGKSSAEIWPALGEQPTEQRTPAPLHRGGQSIQQTYSSDSSPKCRQVPKRNPPPKQPTESPAFLDLFNSFAGTADSDNEGQGSAIRGGAGSEAGSLQSFAESQVAVPSTKPLGIVKPRHQAWKVVKTRRQAPKYSPWVQKHVDSSPVFLIR